MPEDQRAVPDSMAMREAIAAAGEGQYASSRAYAHYLRGLSAQYRSEINDAIEEFKLAVIFDPESPVLRVALAELYRKSGLEDKAQEQLQRATKSDPSYAPAYLALGKVWFLHPRTQNRALGAFRKAVRCDPQNREAYVVLLRVYLELGKQKEAIAVAEAMEATLSWEPVGFQELGQWLAQKGDWLQALHFLKKAQERDPNNIDTLLLMASVYEAMSQDDNAEKYYTKLLTRTPDNGEALYSLGGLLLRKGDIAGGRAYWDQLLTVSPDDADLCAKIAVAFAREGRLPEAVDFFTKAHTISPDDAAVSFFLGRVLEETLDFPKAAVAFASVSEGHELYASALVRRAQSLSRSQQHVAAISLLKEAIAKAPERADWIVELSYVLQSAQRFEESKNVLQQAIRERPKDESLLFGLGVVLERQGKKEEALVPMRKVLGINPRNAEALNFIGYSLAELGCELEEAEDFVTRAIQLRPENGAFVDSLGWIYFKKGNLPKAINLLEKALRLMPDEPAVAEHLGDAYRKASRKKEAERSYRKALEMLLRQPDTKVQGSVERKLRQLHSLVQ